MGNFCDYFEASGGRHATKQRKEYYVCLYEQPLRQHVMSLLYRKWERTTWRILLRIEPLFMNWHESRCDGCATAYRRDGDVVEKVKICGYIPLTSRQDMRLYHVHRRGRRDLIRLPLTAEQYERITGKQTKQTASPSVPDGPEAAGDPPDTPR